MNVYILRHGEADLRRPGLPDADRRLTRQGKRDLDDVLRTVKWDKARPELILTSPLRRAQETAALASAATRCPRIAETRSLLPGARPQRIWKELVALQDVSNVLLAGHEPHFSALVGFLLGSPVSVDFKKGALVRIAVQKQAQPQGVLKWMLTPGLVRQRKR